MGEELLKLNVLYAFAGKDLMNLNDTTYRCIIARLLYM